MRTQPCEAAWPSEPASLVPWKPTEPLKPIQRATSGLSGSPPGMVLPARSPAHSELGTFQVGFFCMLCTLNWPVGVGWPGSPTAAL